MLANQGDRLPVSAFPVDGTWPTGTSKWEKPQHRGRNPGVGCRALHPVQQVRARLPACGDPRQGLRARCAGRRAADLQARAVQGRAVSGLIEDDSQRRHVYTVQVAPEDCTGCSLCVMMCPAKDKTKPRHRALEMAPQPPLRDAERDNYAFFLDAAGGRSRRASSPTSRARSSSQPLFEYSGACAGCGETPYLKLLTQLFGDRLVVANATGCSSIYGGNLPTTPVHDQPRRARAGVGEFAVRGQRRVRLWDAAVDRSTRGARPARSLAELAAQLPAGLADAILSADQTTEAGIQAQRERVAELRERWRRHLGDCRQGRRSARRASPASATTW